MKNDPHPFWVIVQKEMTDHVRSWRYMILLALLLLTCIGSLYAALSDIRNTIAAEEVPSFVFLLLFTGTDESLPPFIQFISFLGPLIGIALGFDAINSERNKGTLLRVLAQPVPRDYIINAKFTASLILISVLFFGLGFLVMGVGMIMTGIPPSFEEFLRLLAFLFFSVIYVSFWLNLAILFSIRFKQAATSALSSLAIWLFFSVFYEMIIRLIVQTRLTAGMAAEKAGEWYMVLQRFSPSKLFEEATSTLLMPEIYSLSPLTNEQRFLYIPRPLDIGQSMLLVWPQLTALIAVTMLCFGISYVMFVRRDIRT